MKYNIHDNGGRPFKVHIIDDIAKIFYHRKLLLQYEITKPFIGKSPKNKMTIYHDSYGKNYDGNTILLHLMENKYIFIGPSIYSFDSYDTIVEYISPVGRNDVAYPYAVDKSGNIYLMVENTVIMNISNNIINNIADIEDPYINYYNSKEEICQLNGIAQFYIGKNKYNLSYTYNPEKYYDRFLNDFEDDEVDKYGIHIVKIKFCM